LPIVAGAIAELGYTIRYTTALMRVSRLGPETGRPGAKRAFSSDFTERTVELLGMGACEPVPKDHERQYVNAAAVWNEIAPITRVFPIPSRFLAFQ
jgi:hypothetical protein